MKTIKSISGALFFGALLALLVFQPNANAKTKTTSQTEHINLRVSGMMCTECSKSLESGLEKLKGAENIKADYNTGSASLDVCPNCRITKAQLNKAVSDAGFTLKEVKFVKNTKKPSDLNLKSQ